MLTTSGLLVATPSLTVNMNVSCPLLLGAVNCGLDMVLSVKVTGSPAVWIHEYVIVSPSTSRLWDPSNCTTEFASTVWSAPELDIGISWTAWMVIPMGNNLLYESMVAFTVRLSPSK